jgi:hypothetical protein
MRTSKYDALSDQELRNLPPDEVKSFGEFLIANVSADGTRLEIELTQGERRFLDLRMRVFFKDGVTFTTRNGGLELESLSDEAKEKLDFQRRMTGNETNDVFVRDFGCTRSTLGSMTMYASHLSCGKELPVNENGEIETHFGTLTPNEAAVVREFIREWGTKQPKPSTGDFWKYVRLAVYQRRM